MLQVIQINLEKQSTLAKTKGMNQNSHLFSNRYRFPTNEKSLTLGNYTLKRS